MNKLISLFLLLLSGAAFAQSESDFYTPPTAVGIERNLVTDYAVNNSDTLDDSELLQKAINEVSATANGGKITIPAGTYYLVEVSLASDVHLEFDAGANIIPYNDTTLRNYSIFTLGRNTDYIENVQISCPNGKFTVDFTKAKNNRGRVISLYSVDNFSVGDFKVLDDISIFSALTGGISSYNNTWLKPKNGLVKNIEVHNAHYGYGVVQMQTGQNIFFKDLWGDGGVTLRFETGYSKMNELQVGGVFDLYGQNIYCENGNAAVMISPHAIDNGHVEVDSITSVNCGFAVRIGEGYATKEQRDSFALDGGYFANTCKVSHVKATYGTTAQVKSKHFKYMPCAERSMISSDYNPDGESYAAPAIVAVLNTAEGSGEGKFKVTISDVESVGFPHQSADILYEDDSVDDCTSALEEPDVAFANVYPTVVNQRINIEHKAQSPLTYRLLSLYGQMIMQGEVLSNSIELPSNLPPGTYIFSLQHKTDRQTTTMIKR